MSVELPTLTGHEVELSSGVFSQPKIDPPRKLAEKCAVFGIYGESEGASEKVAQGLFALQHRGQESSGVVSSDGEVIFDHRKPGLVSQVYEGFDFSTLPGNMAVGHNRYGTFNRREGIESHLQPVIGEPRDLTLGHNGNLPDTSKLEEFLDRHGLLNTQDNDTEMMHKAISHHIARGASLEDAILESAPLFTGAYSLTVMDRNKIAAVRDPRGIRPLAIGRLNGGYVFSSETCGLDIIGAQYLREVNPGEMVVVDHNGLRSIEFAPGEQRLDVFEFVYLARPDSNLLGKNVYQVRKNFGRILATEAPVKADIVVPVPDSAIPAGMGYSEASGIPYDEAIVKNRYIGRTFITPNMDRRAGDVAMKLNPIPEVLNNQRVVLIEDSIVRATTSRKIIRMVRDAGAREVHLRISSPPISFPDYYGIDTPTQAELPASRMSVEEICRMIGADSLEYLSLDGLIKGTGLSADVLSVSAFTGEYPISIGKRREEVVYSANGGKHQ